MPWDQQRWQWQQHQVRAEPADLNSLAAITTCREKIRQKMMEEILKLWEDEQWMKAIGIPM